MELLPKQQAANDSLLGSAYKTQHWELVYVWEQNVILLGCVQPQCLNLLSSATLNWLLDSDLGSVKFLLTCVTLGPPDQALWTTSLALTL